MSAPLWEWLRERAVEIHLADHLCDRLRRGDQLRVKLGLDPTAPDLHVGHLVQLDVLRAFQDAGHTVVAIVGDYTARIGDPSGRSRARPVLSREQVDANARTYFDQLFKVLDPGRTEVHGNSEWLAEMDAADILRLLGKQTLQSVLQREDFAKRLRDGDPIGAHEILYPFNQAYDSVAIRADVEIGGTDQLFNLLFGREIQRAYGQPAQDIAVFPLLEGLDGERKMSKSLGNTIGILDPPDQVYGRTMSIPDPLTEKYLRLVSGLSAERVAEILALGPRDAKAALARRLVERLHGPEAATTAEAEFDRRFRRREASGEAEERAVAGLPLPLPALLHEVLRVAPTRKKAFEQIRDGAVRVNGEVADEHRAVEDGDRVDVGRRHSYRVRAAAS
jgi:tyrosyl-tRNA synthetase